MTGSSRLLALALAVLVAVTVLPWAVPAGSSDAPEVRDPCDDADAGSTGVTAIESADVGGLWYEWKPVDGVIEQYLIICHDEIRHRRARASNQIGWTVNWTDGRGREWSQRVWGTGLLSDKTGINHQLCHGDEAVGPDRPADLDDGVAKLTINNALDETRFEEALYETYVVAGRYPPPSPDHTTPAQDCELGFAETFDRAPADGEFGDVFELEARRNEQVGHGIEMVPIRPDRTMEAGETIRIDIEFNNTVAEIRNVTLDLDHDLPSDFPVALQPDDIAMPPEGEAEATVGVRAPRTATDGTYELEVTGVVRNATLVRLGSVNATLELRVDAHTFRPVIPTEASGPTTPPGAVVEHEVEIVNGGTARDRFRLDVGGGPSGWVHLPTDAVTLEADGSRNLTLKIRVPADAEPGWYEHRLTATSVTRSDAVAEVGIVTGVVLTDDGVIAESGATLPGPSAWAVVVAAGAAAGLLRRRD